MLTWRGAKERVENYRARHSQFERAIIGRGAVAREGEVWLIGGEGGAERIVVTGEGEDRGDGGADREEFIAGGGAERDGVKSPLKGLGCVRAVL